MNVCTDKQILDLTAAICSDKAVTLSCAPTDVSTDVYNTLMRRSIELVLSDMVTVSRIEYKLHWNAGHCIATTASIHCPIDNFPITCVQDRLSAVWTAKALTERLSLKLVTIAVDDPATSLRII